MAAAVAASALQQQQQHHQQQQQQQQQNQHYQQHCQPNDIDHQLDVTGDGTLDAESLSKSQVAARIRRADWPLNSAAQSRPQSASGSVLPFERHIKDEPASPSSSSVSSCVGAPNTPSSSPPSSRANSTIIKRHLSPPCPRSANAILSSRNHGGSGSNSSNSSSNSSTSSNASISHKCHNNNNIQANDTANNNPNSISSQSTNNDNNNYAINHVSGQTQTQQMAADSASLPVCSAVATPNTISSPVAVTAAATPNPTGTGSGTNPLPMPFNESPFSQAHLALLTSLFGLTAPMQWNSSLNIEQ